MAHDNATPLFDQLHDSGCMPVDYPAGPRFVRPIPTATLHRIYGDERPDLYAALAASDRRARIARWQRRVALACYALAVLTAMYFAFQLGRGAL